MKLTIAMSLVVGILTASLVFSGERRCCDECPATPGMAPSRIASDMNAIDRMCCLVFLREWRGSVWPMYDFNCDKVMNVVDIVVFADRAFRDGGRLMLDCEE